MTCVPSNHRSYPKGPERNNAFRRVQNKHADVTKLFRTQSKTRHNASRVIFSSLMINIDPSTFSLRRSSRVSNDVYHYYAAHLNDADADEIARTKVNILRK